MRFENSDIEKFAELWREEFGERISPDEARQRASEIMELYFLLAEMPGESSQQQDSRTQVT